MAPKKARKKKVAAKRQAWNKGLEIGKKDAFTPDQVKRIRSILVKRDASGLRDLALFSTAIDTMLQGRDLLELHVRDAASKRFDPFNHQGLEEKERSAGQMRSF